MTDSTILKKNKKSFTREIFTSKFSEIIESFKPYVQSQLLSNLIKEKKSTDESSIIFEFLTSFETNWANSEFKKSSISGKEFFEVLNTWLGQEYAVSISVNHITYNINENEIHTELVEVLNQFSDTVRKR